MEYSSAIVDLRTDVPTFSTVITTPGIKAPDESRMVPTIVPNVDCAVAASLHSINPIEITVTSTTDKIPDSKRFAIVSTNVKEYVQR
jgi:hypothetical protein